MGTIRAWLGGIPFVAMILLTISADVHAVVIDTTESRVGAYVSPFGEGGNATYGQTFATDPRDRVLDSFSLYLTNKVGQSLTSVYFRAYIYEWNGSRAIGESLYVSSVREKVPAVFNGNEDIETSAYTFSTGGLSLRPRREYVAFLSVSGLFDGSPDQTGMSMNLNDPYSDGQFVFLNNGNNLNLATAMDWDKRFLFYDAWFKASFSSRRPGHLPEPATIALLSAGFLIFVAIRRRPGING